MNLEYMDAQVATGSTGSEFEKLVMSDDTTYDIFCLTQWCAVKYSYQNMYYNMADAPYISYDQPWWSCDYMKSMTIGSDKLYCMVGDMHIDSVRCLNCMYYNKNLYENHYSDPDGMYDVVLEGKWTYDLLQQISGEVWSDTDGDSRTTFNDQLGYTINSHGNLE